jgi:tripartite-type tricarboxylate transporter receptor subunit TctC
MTLPRRRFLHLAASAAALPSISHFAWAQAYSTQPVRIVVGFAAGGSADVLARLMGQWLEARLGQSFVIENRPGIGGNLAAEEVVKAPADGHMLLLAGVNNAVSATLYDKLDFVFPRDIVPLAGIARAPNVIAVHPSVPATTVSEFIAYAGANPGRIAMGSAGIGSSSHVAGELFSRATRVQMVHMPCRGETSALADVLAGDVQVFFAALPGSIEPIRAGNLRALAVTSATRSHALPGIPTVAETVPGYQALGWFGLVAPRNTPPEIVGRLNTAINAALADAKMRVRLADLGAAPLTGSPADFSRFVAGETARWAEIIRAAHVAAV